jgi:hypothetical protein
LQGGSKSQHALHSDEFGNDFETTVDAAGGSTSEASKQNPRGHEDSEMSAPSKAHLELRKGFRMSQLYLQRAVQPSSAAGAASSRAESADSTNGAADRRVSPRLTNPTITSRRKKREWWKASADEDTSSSDGAVGDAESESISSRSAKKQKQEIPKLQKKSKQMSQQSAGKKPPQSGAGMIFAHIAWRQMTICVCVRWLSPNCCANTCCANAALWLSGRYAAVVTAKHQ